MNHDDRTMLALAALTYRGFGHHSDAVVATKLDPWLPLLHDEGLGRWERVWGPASFRAPASLVDDAMVFVAKQQDRAKGEKPRYVVAIRGTNPVSFFDWFFGDLWVRHQLPWPGAPGARLSASTALGLAMVKNLTAEPPSRGGNFAPVANGLASALQRFAIALPELPVDRLLREPGFLTQSNLLTRIGALTDHAGAALRQGVFGTVREHFERSTKPLTQSIEQHVFELLLEDIDASRGSTATLLQFLDRVVKEPATVAVVGHSKGGALAVATALWLAEEWAPSKQAVVECFSFAGPTAGNGDFARHYDKVLADRTRCIVNTRDIVPHAWATDDLDSIGGVHPLLDAATNALSRSVAGFRYTHVGGSRFDFTRRPPASPRPLVQELIHQHLDAYLEEADFKSAKWKTESLFLDP